MPFLTAAQVIGQPKVAAHDQRRSSYPWAPEVRCQSKVSTLHRRHEDMKGTVCQLHYHGGGCLRSVHPRPDGSSSVAAWPFATAPHGLKVGDAVTFTLTEGGQAVDLRGAWGMVYGRSPTNWVEWLSI
eukprot:Skav214478  [mRNA]  locus=scaffold1167:336563:337306:+ [translate_table: standard]